MWIKSIPFQHLARDGRWKVEFFSGVQEAVPNTPYEIVKLGDIVKESRATLDPQAEPDRQFNYLGLENVETLTGDLVDFNPRHGREIKSRTKTFAKGDVLYGRLRPYLNKVFVAEGTITDGICSGEFYVLKPNSEKVLPVLLRTLLSLPHALDRVARFQSGAALPRVPLKDLLEVPIPLPPLEDQADMVKFLIKMANKRRRLKNELKELPALTQDLMLRSLGEGNCACLLH